jgi:uncharacterized protein YkwD
MKKPSISLLSIALSSFFVLAGLTGSAKAQPEPQLLYSGNENTAGAASTGKYLEQDILDLINKERTANNLQPLAWDPKVAELARLHSKDMGWNNYFNHRGLDGKMVSDRAEANGLDWHMIGENIAMVSGFSDPVNHVVTGWLQSPGHRKNILDPRWKETGIGIFITSNGTYYFTQVFLSKQ